MCYSGWRSFVKKEEEDQKEDHPFVIDCGSRNEIMSILTLATNHTTSNNNTKTKLQQQHIHVRQQQ